MKKTVLGRLMLAAVASWGLMACTDGIGTGFGQSDGTGKISLSADLDPSLRTKTSSRAEYDEVGKSDLSVRLISADGSTMGPWTMEEFTSEERRVNVGYYTVEAYYGNAGEQGFEKPYFYGKAEQVKVEENKTTSVQLVATVKNAAVEMRYTDAFKNYMSSWSANVNNIEVTSDEKRPVYVNTGETTINLTFEKPSGASATMQVKKFDALEAMYYVVTVDLASGTGVVEGIQVTIDEEVTDEDVIIDISDAVLMLPAPEVSTSGFTPGETLTYIKGQTFANPVAFNVVARGGLGEVVLTAESPALLAKGWPESIDLLNADDAAIANLEQLGLKLLGLRHNPDKMAVVDLTNVITSLGYVEGSTNQHVFTLNVVDKYGKTVEEPITLTAVAQKVELTLSNPQYVIPSDGMTVDVCYTGGDPTGVIEIRKPTASGGNGVLLNTTYEKIGDNLYRATCTGAAIETDQDFNIYAVSKLDDELATEPMTIAPVVLLVLEQETATPNVFAKKAYLPVTYALENGSIENGFANSKLMISAAAARSGEFVEAQATEDTANKQYYLTDLTPGTTYTVKLFTNNIETSSLTFTTEAAAQLENGNLDDNVTTVASAKNWQEVGFTGWGTANNMTTSQGNNYAYCRISGTIQTTDAHSGKAALIRSVGWGSGNAATGSGGSSGKCKYTDAGLLHLGANRTGSQHNADTEFSQKNSTSHGKVTTEDLDCGIEFASRPSGVSFWYKYTAKNSSDKGLAEVQVLDAEGNVISSGRLLLGATGNYTQQTINLDYATAVKAAKIYVKFMSTHSSEFLVRTNDNFSGPGFANLSDGTFMGSQLYIDDIELNY